MKKHPKLLTVSCLAALQMIICSASVVYANNYDARTDDVDQVLMFPGDVLFGASDLLIGENEEEAVTGPEGEYTFSDGIVYRALKDQETGVIRLLPFGHTVSVDNGISECEDLYEDTHYSLYQAGISQEDYFVMEEEESDEDLAAYPQGITVKISAGEATDGEVFDHWETTDDIVLSDPFSRDTTFVMGDKGVTLEAVFVPAEDSYYNADDEYGDLASDDDIDEYGPESNGWDDGDFNWDEENGADEEDDWDDEDDLTLNPEALDGFEEEEEEPLDISEGWSSEQMSAFDIPGSDEGSDSIFDHLDPEALGGNGTQELDEYIEKNAELNDDMAFETPEPAPGTSEYEEKTSQESVDTPSGSAEFNMNSLLPAGDDEEPEEAEEEVKTYRIRIVSDHVYVYGDVTVNDDNEIRAEKGAVVNLQADTLDDFEFDHWEITKRSSGEEVPADNKESENTFFTMPGGSVNVSAVYTERIIETHKVSIKHGTGGGSFAAGETVSIVADTALPGEKFKKWKVTAGNVSLENSGLEQTSFVMGNEDVSLQAIYEYIYYNLKVTSGSGGGSYKKGDVVTLTAQWPADGKEFDSWLVNSANATVARADRFETTLTMPADHVSVQALYKNGPSVSDNKINGITSDSVFMRGETFSFSATGAGMDNADPNPGDYRWKPSGYRIGSASGTFTDGRYAASMAVNAMGNYTLYVDYKKEVWNGTSWEANGATDTRSVSFVVSAPNAVQTGDDTPILPFVIAAGAALILIIVLVALRMRKKK